ncbi:DUF2147 domain-containing protein [Luteimonas sp. MC1782]|uniref:DUF2147 domain-containing protein n=1 Tax=Luteimonas sp. MC1782 TaxID=2760305 RepID=UPI0015FF7200|nr:DUF2147 domain-containing protein [Luteimonas sp. MC1782]MBB1472316.1 DUF2147 domain-containing protein [Luteimonas sp. MC1782]
MRKPLFILLAMMLASPAIAADAVGRWKTIDDETGKVKSIVEITEAGGKLSGRVVDILHSDRGPNPACDECDGANKGKPIKGMTILWGLKPDSGEWTGGHILDPAKGKTYKAKAKLIDDNRLGVSGCVAFICREQVWVRE